MTKTSYKRMRQVLIPGHRYSFQYASPASLTLVSWCYPRTLYRSEVDQKFHFLLLDVKYENGLAKIEVLNSDGVILVRQISGTDFLRGFWKIERLPE